jgi:choline dehydrogenase-like flavoprotein
MSENVDWPKASEGGRVMGKEEIRAYWTRQWAEFDPHVEPIEVTEREASRIDVRVMPGMLVGEDLEQFVREATGNFSHQACTAKMGTDALSVVNADLKVYGVDNLRVADASVLPHTMTGNAMAACVVVGERLVKVLGSEHRL